VNSLTDLPDLAILASLKKVKADKKTGFLDVSGSVMLNNSGSLALNGALVQIYYSQSPFYENDLPFVGAFVVPKLPVPGKKGVKVRKKSFKISTGTTQPGYLLFTVIPLDPLVNDRDYYSNLDVEAMPGVP
jgi:hypothetical protein